jgi:hypothetical protein
LQYYGYEDKRPGGRTATTEIKSTISSTPETYHLIGDDRSVRAVLEALMSNCSVQDTKGTVATFDRDSSSKAVWPERVVQYYRGSSFGLSLDTYNNTASILSNQPKDNNTAPPVLVDTPLPTGLNMTFLACLNATIGFSLPLIEADPHKHLSKGAVAGIIIGSIFGGLFLFVGLNMLILGWMDKRANRRFESSFDHKPKSKLGSMPLPFKRIFAFGQKKDKKGSRGRYSSLETPDGASPPESQNLAVNAGDKPPVFKEMVEEPEIIPPALPVYETHRLNMPEPKVA